MLTTSLLIQSIDQARTSVSATDQLLDRGLSGLIILGLLVALLFLQKRNDKLHDQIDALNGSRLADRDLRLADSQANARVILEVSDRYKETMLANTSELRELKDEIQNLRPRQYR